jgi:hypothetical protein
MPFWGRPAAARLQSPLLSDTRADGPVVGYCDGQPIAEAIMDRLGRRYVFAGVVTCQRDGAFDLTTLAAGEWLIQPGLIYRRDESR